MADAYSVKSTPYTLQCIFLILCSKITDILNICIWEFTDEKIIVDDFSAINFNLANSLPLHILNNG